MPKIAGQMRDEEYEYELPTSFIDVTFLLVIFFMVNLQFRSTEKKLDAELPKDEGLNPVFTKVVQPTEIRVKVYWANGQGQIIHSHAKPFPDNWPGVRVPLSVDRAHIELRVNKMAVANLTDLARVLQELGAKDPTMPVVIDARQAVPFRWVIGALDACSRAGIKTVKFQAPPAEGGGGDDWWWM